MQFWLGFQSGIMFSAFVLVVVSEIYKRKMRIKYKQYDELIAKSNTMYETAQWYSLMKMTKDANECLELAKKYYADAEAVFNRNGKKTADKKDSKK